MQDGGKKRINFKRLGIYSLVAFSSFMIWTSFFVKEMRPGHSKKSDKRLIAHGEIQTASVHTVDHFETATVATRPKPVEREVEQQPAPPKEDIPFRAKQVISRDEAETKKNRLQIGSNIIGKLLTAVDSRDLSSFIKVLLPYGVKSNGEEILPKGTTLIGKANYSGKGERVFLNFEKAILPDGNEKAITAHALDSRDYANGVIGVVHSESGMRMAGTLGLTMVAGMADVLTEKTSLGSMTAITPKSTMKNALLQGTSKAAQMDASREASNLAQTQSYITLEAGEDLIITLTSNYGGD